MNLTEEVAAMESAKDLTSYIKSLPKGNQEYDAYSNYYTWRYLDWRKLGSLEFVRKCEEIRQREEDRWMTQVRQGLNYVVADTGVALDIVARVLSSYFDKYGSLEVCTEGLGNSIRDALRHESETKMDHKPCPFCGGKVDPEGWMSSGGATGPECEDCGATASTIERWDAARAPRVEDI